MGWTEEIMFPWRSKARTWSPHLGMNHSLNAKAVLGLVRPSGRGASGPLCADITQGPLVLWLSSLPCTLFSPQASSLPSSCL